MNQKIKEHITQYLISKGLKTVTDRDIFNELNWESEEVWEGGPSRHRWWNTTFKVVKVNGMLIGFRSATATGDDAPEDLGWEFDPKTVCEVVAEEVKTIVYKPA